MTDTHVHLDDARYGEAERQEILDNLERDGLTAVINAACDLTSMRAGARLAERCSKVFFTVGCHPHDAKNYDDAFEREIVRLAKNPKAVAMGEIGLDYHYDLSERDVQKEVFSRQLSLARKLGLPVVLHTRDAWKDTLDILREEGSFPHGLLLHCFSGSAEIMKILSEKYDAYFAFGGAITFKNYGGAELVRTVGENRLLCETDCPYLTPEPFRGKVNRPAFVRYTLEKIAAIRGIAFSEAERITENNAARFFGLEKLFENQPNTQWGRAGAVTLFPFFVGKRL